MAAEPALGRRSVAAAFALLATLGTPGAALAAEALPPWQRAGLVPLSADECQELRVEQIGEGVLELRFFTEPLLRPSGPDPKTSGASLMFAAEDLERASFVVYDRSGIYARTTQIAAPIRWSQRGSALCVASGSTTVACAPVAGGILGTMQIAFGAGWQAEITGCGGIGARERPIRAWALAAAAFVALALLAVRASRRRWDGAAVGLLALCFVCAAIAAIDPWRLPSVGIVAAAMIVSALTAAWALFGRRRSPAQRVALVALALFATIALVRVPHPVWVARPVEPAVPPLWLDAANWHPRAAHQSLEFRDRPLAAIEPGAETWLVLGGSVVFGEGVEAERTFTAVAQDRLRARGSPIVLLNAGAQGWNIQNVDRLLADLADALPITGLVVVSILNNTALPIAASRAYGCDRSLLRAWLCIVSRNQLLFAGPKALLPKPSNPERFRSTLQGLLARELRLGRKVVLLDEVAEFHRAAPWLWNTDAVRASAREVAAEFGVPFHPVDDALAPLAPEQRFLDGIHPTPAMHVLLGARLAEILGAGVTTR